MARITRIKQQVKRKDRYSIYIDGKYTFSFSEDELVTSGLRRDQELSPSQLKNLQKSARADKAYDRSLRYLAIRPRSRWEIVDYLGKKGYEEPIITRALKKLTKLKLIDDAAFAKTWVEWRQLGHGRSLNQLRAELIKKRIDREIIASTLEGIDTSTQLEQIKSIIERKSKLAQYQNKQKLIAYLARQGWPYHLIKQALEEIEP